MSQVSYLSLKQQVQLLFTQFIMIKYQRNVIKYEGKSSSGTYSSYLLARIPFTWGMRSMQQPSDKYDASG